MRATARPKVGLDGSFNLRALTWTHKGLGCCEADAMDVCAGDEDSLALNSSGEGFSNLEGFCVGTEVWMGS